MVLRVHRSAYTLSWAGFHLHHIRNDTRTFRYRTTAAMERKRLGKLSIQRDFKRVPAVYKCFNIIEHLATSKKPFGISEIASELGYHRSTVFNMVYSLVDLKVLHQEENGKFSFGTRLYALGKAADRNSELIHMVRPYLEALNAKTGLTAFLGVRSELRAVVVDKVETAKGLKLSSDVGTSHSLLAGAGGKAMLAQLPDDELDAIIDENELICFTPQTCVDKKLFKEHIRQVRKDGIAYDMEEYSEGIRAVAVPLKNGNNIQVAIWAVGLKSMLSDGQISAYSEYIKQIAQNIMNHSAN